MLSRSKDLYLKNWIWGWNILRVTRILNKSPRWKVTPIYTFMKIYKNITVCNLHFTINQKYQYHVYLAQKTSSAISAVFLSIICDTHGKQDTSKMTFFLDMLLVSAHSYISILSISKHYRVQEHNTFKW